MLDQHFEQCELAGSECDHAALTGECARGKVEHACTKRELAFNSSGCSWRVWSRATAQPRIDARHQFAGVERLQQVIVGAQLEADDAIEFVGFLSEHDDV